ncbi:hypothetical protein [Moorena sp. SIO3A2]|uniref:hypothetical protein n=1 Tax=Moorena sp. SIO3A2 TaxID=2607841 RepID=UPI0013BD969A|nr:hypothetical protein [Moorena sp. SIO3A2]NER91556.1 hypothetical protein [Moorena sp. SIO3A2]
MYQYQDYKKLPLPNNFQLETGTVKGHFETVLKKWFNEFNKVSYRNNELLSVTTEVQAADILLWKATGMVKWVSTCCDLDRQGECEERDDTQPITIETSVTADLKVIDQSLELTNLLFFEESYSHAIADSNLYLPNPEPDCDLELFSCFQVGQYKSVEWKEMFEQ